MCAAAWADSVNSPNITMNVDTNRAVGNGAGNVSVTVNTITIAETMLPEYSSGAGKTITLRTRAGYQFDPTSAITAQSATIGFNGGGINTVATVVPGGGDQEIITFALTSGTNANTQDIIRINGVKLRILSAAGAAGPAQTTMTLTTSTAGGAFTDQGVVAANITKGVADHIAFAAQPGNVQAGDDLLPAVKIVDFGENLVTNDTRAITLALLNNPTGASLLGTAQRDTVAGVATWADADNLRITSASTGYTLRASHSGAALQSSDTADSLAFNISSGVAGSLRISRQPLSTPAGGDILIDVTALDSFGNVATATPVNITIDSAVNPGGWPLLATSSLTKQTVNGVASWSAADDLHITKAVGGYRLIASGVGAPALTDLFDITPGAASALRFVQQPTNTVQNVVMAPLPSVEIIDAFANRTNDTSTISLALGTAPCGGALSNATAAAVAGLATFNGFEIDTVCDGDTLTATSGALVAAESNAFNITESDFGEDTPPDNMPTCGACGQSALSAMLWLTFAQLGLRGLIRRRKL